MADRLMTPRGEMMRRVQVGLVGLGVILMILLIASAIASRLRSDTVKPGMPMPVKPMEKSPDPAAKLGIAPANAPENVATTPAPAGQLPNPSGLPTTSATTQQATAPATQPGTQSTAQPSTPP